MEADEIVLGGKQYIVFKTLYRTKGSSQQHLTTTKNHNTEHRRTFYIVSRNGSMFWIKEYTQPSYGHSILYEFDETIRLFDTTMIGEHRIKPVRMIAVDQNRLLMEYCDGFVKLIEARLTSNEQQIVYNLIFKWIHEHDVHNYDLCGNNILIKINGNIDIRLIDFEYSVGVNRRKWLNFLEKMKYA